MNRRSLDDRDLAPPSHLIPPRICAICKWSEFQGYGFNLHGEKAITGQFVGQVDAYSPAALAHLETNMRIVDVNGTNISNENHQQVVSRIKMAGDSVELFVVDKNTDDWCRDNDVILRRDMPHFNIDVYSTPSSPPLDVRKALGLSIPDEVDSSHLQNSHSAVQEPSDSVNYEVIDKNIPSQKYDSIEQNLTNGTVVPHANVSVGDDQSDDTRDESSFCVDKKADASPVLKDNGDDTEAINDYVDPGYEKVKNIHGKMNKIDYLEVNENEKKNAHEAVEIITNDRSIEQHDVSFGEGVSDTNDSVDAGYHSSVLRNNHIGFDDQISKENQQQKQQLHSSSHSYGSNEESLVSSSIVPTEATQRHPISSQSSENNSQQSDAASYDPLGLGNISAAEMRQRLKAQKKKDVRDQNMSTREKYKLVQEL